MRKVRGALCLSVLCLVLGGCSTAPTNTVTQVSTIDALLAGAYDGEMDCGRLLSYGDLGIGTFHGLDGEMVILGGKVYQIKADGEVTMPPETTTTPFASVVMFSEDTVTPIARDTDLEAFEGRVNEAAPNMNTFCAIRARGRFSRMKTRSVPAQKKPYPPLAEVTKDQPVFQMENVTGTLVGFRSPAFVKGVNVPGFHLHFLSDDRRSGGHVLEFSMVEGEAEVDVCNRFFMILPGDESAFGSIDLSRDRSKELEKVEKSGEAVKR